MTINYLTVDQHQTVLDRLLILAGRASSEFGNESAFEGYASLMRSLLLYSASAAGTLRLLATSLGTARFPAPVGFGITRTLFETDIAAHYISVDPAVRATQYINFASVLKKRRMDACARHRSSKHADWREGMDTEWLNVWAPIEAGVNRRYEAVRSQFQRSGKKGKLLPFQNWSGKTIREMAVEVDHEESYDVFYSYLSSFAHVDVHLADHFVRLGPNGVEWSAKSDEGQVGHVFRFAAIFLSCFLELYGHQIKTWSSSDVRDCWEFNEA